MQEDEARNLALVRRWYREVWCEGSAAAAREMTAPGVVAHLESAPDTDLDGFLEFHRALLRGIEGLHVEILEATAGGDKVVVHWHLTGVHTDELMGIPASGRTVDEWGMTKFRFVKGRVVEGWDSWNLNAFLESLASPDRKALASRHRLTDRQVEVALMMAEGASAKRIAADLGIAHNTARRHCQDVLRRLGIHSREDVREALATPIRRAERW